MPDVAIGHHGDVIVDEMGSACLFIEWLDWNSGETWSDLEDALGELDYDSVFSDISQELDDDHPFNGIYDAEDLADSIRTSVSWVITDRLLEWIQSVDTQNVKKKYQLDPFGFYLTFNYTMLLEKIYGISSNRVCHIHGSIEEGDLIIGHGCPYGQEICHNFIYGDSAQAIHDSLRKNTKKAIERHGAFFGDLFSRKITDIYCLGCGIGSADLPYFQFLFSAINTKMVRIHFSEFEEKRGECVKKIARLRAVGFKGAISRCLPELPR